MEVISTITEMRQWVKQHSGEGATLGLAPTLGALHRGHQRLIETSVQTTNKTVVSLFVNPLQFGPNEDYERYPRTFEQDRALAAQAGAHVIFHPSVEEMYPDGRAEVHIDVGSMGQVLCGRTRPMHFSGVATVVLKLLNIIQPTAVFLGSKDAQQLAIIERMVRDLDLTVSVCPVATVREADGLALSSRNRYLSDQERVRATALWRGLMQAKESYQKGERRQAVLIRTVQAILEHEAISPEYIEIRAWKSLKSLPATIPPIAVVLAVAARLGQARLIDNVILEP